MIKAIVSNRALRWNACRLLYACLNGSTILIIEG